MVKKKKMWKPGHLVTIEDKVYRVKRTIGGSDCNPCCGRNKPITSEPCNTCFNDYKMPFYCHFEEIKPKSVMG